MGEINIWTATGGANKSIACHYFGPPAKNIPKGIGTSRRRLQRLSLRQAAGKAPLVTTGRGLGLTVSVFEAEVPAKPRARETVQSADKAIRALTVAYSLGNFAR